jgi:hypothetical protein
LKRRALLILAAAVLSVAAVFVSGYAVGVHRGGSAPGNAVVRTLVLRGTSVAPHARARLEIGPARDANWPITLSVIGLPKSPPHTYYEVDLARDGKPWKSCGTFRAPSASHAVTLTLNAPFALRKGDTWVVTRQSGRQGGVTVGREGGVTALRQV